MLEIFAPKFSSNFLVSLLIPIIIIINSISHIFFNGDANEYFLYRPNISFPLPFFPADYSKIKIQQLNFFFYKKMYKVTDIKNFNPEKGQTLLINTFTDPRGLPPILRELNPTTKIILEGMVPSSVFYACQHCRVSCNNDAWIYQYARPAILIKDLF